MICIIMVPLKNSLITCFTISNCVKKYCSVFFGTKDHVVLQTSSEHQRINYDPFASHKIDRQLNI